MRRGDLPSTERAEDKDTGGASDPMRKLLIAGLLACTCLQPALALPIAYDEASDGDLIEGSFGASLPVLGFDLGTNTIKGTFGAPDSGGFDFDHFAFLVPSGLRVVSATVTLADSVGDIASTGWFLFSGSNTVGSGTFVGSFPVSSPGAATLPGLPLGASTYNLLQYALTGAFPALSTYTFEFVVEAVAAPVPEPATTAVWQPGLLRSDSRGGGGSPERRILHGRA